MSFDFDPIYLVWLFVAISAGLTVEAIYLMCFSTASYRSRINRRLMLSKDRTDRESILIELRRERGLTSGGNFRLNLVSLNRLVLQSGLTIGFARLILVIAIATLIAFGVTMFLRNDIMQALLAALFSATVLPYMALRFLRGRRQKKFGAQFPDAIDIIVRSLRAGHPVPIAINMVGREMTDPIGSEFGIVTDEITYGADLETAMRNLYFRGRDPGLDRRQSRRNPGKPLRRHSPAFQDAAQDSRAGGGRPRLGDDPLGTANRHVPGHPAHRARLLRFRVA
jgi:tight adherence protein B